MYEGGLVQSSDLEYMCKFSIAFKTNPQLVVLNSRKGMKTHVGSSFSAEEADST